MFSLSQLWASIFTRKAKVNNLQDAYEAIRAHFLKQKERAVEYGTCQYRTGNGLMCAVGCLITDGNYEPKLEGNTIYSDNVRKAVMKSTGLNLRGYDNPVLSFLTQAQNIHDRRADRLNVDGVEMLDRVAASFNLEVKG